MMRIIIIVVLSIFFQISGCSTFKVANNNLIKAEAYKEVKTGNISPAEAIYNASMKLKEAQDAGLTFYSPLHMKKAQHKLAKANSLKRLRSSKRSRIAAATAALIVIKIIESAEKNKTVVENKLSDILKQKAVLDELNAEKVLAVGYKVGIKKITRLVKYIERGKYDRVVSLQPDVLNYLNKLESDTLKITALLSAKAMLTEARAIKAEKYARLTFASANKSYQSALESIGINYKDRSVVASVSETAYLSAAHAFFVALEAQKIIHTDALAVEKYVLNVQDLLLHISKSLGMDDLYRYSFKEQAALIHKAITLQSAALKFENKKQKSSVKVISESVPAVEKPKVREIIDTKSNQVTDARNIIAENNKGKLDSEVEIVEEVSVFRKTVQ